MREEKEEETRRAEQALKRAESNVQRLEREERERRVLAKVRKDEREKQEEGKKGWWMKDGESLLSNPPALFLHAYLLPSVATKRALMNKARFEDLESKGGKQAVKKALEKKKRKVAQKEKKARPSWGDEGARKPRRLEEGGRGTPQRGWRGDAGGGGGFKKRKVAS